MYEFCHIDKNSLYDYLIVGAGLFGSVFAGEATHAGKKCIVDMPGDITFNGG